MIATVQTTTHLLVHPRKRRDRVTFRTEEGSDQVRVTRYERGQVVWSGDLEVSVARNFYRVCLDQGFESF